MFTGSTVFAQLLDYLPRHGLSKCVARYDGDSRLREFSCRDQFLPLAFAQLTYRDIETCRGAMGPKLDHAGFRGRISRSTLADANNVISPRTLRRVTQEDHVRTRFDHRRSLLEPLPVGEISPSESRDQDAHASRPSRQHPVFHPCFPGQNARRQHSFLASHRNLDFRHGTRRPVDRATGLRSDTMIRLNSVQTSKHYPDPLRRVAFHDAEHDRRLVFLTNNTHLAAITIAKLFRARWQVELFFKWIKKNLRIKAFYGRTENAVKTQIWIAISVDMLVAIVRKELKLERSQPHAVRENAFGSSTFRCETPKRRPASP
jgi:Domain of unknown function (DUF4372)/Transposase DDE domain